MRRGLRLGLLALALALGVAFATKEAGAETFTRRWARSAQPSPVSLPGPQPYYGRALGATYYNWGYFGARHHTQISRYAGYQGDARRCSVSKGY